MIIRNVFVLMLAASSAFSQKASVLVLGTYHMANPGLDKFNMQADDVMVPKRQKEIEEFVSLLMKFKPTVVCIEYPVDKQSQLDATYQSYLNGTYELRKNESDQVGLRLAKKAGLRKVYAIDSKAPFDMDTVIKVAQKYQFNDFLKKLSELPAYLAEGDQKLYKSTITEFFQYLNEEENVKFAHALYMDMVPIGNGNNFAGADLVADWYKRNLRIYANLRHVVITPNDRVLILYGAGHTKILQELVSNSGDLQLVKLSEIK